MALKFKLHTRNLSISPHAGTADVSNGPSTPSSVHLNPGSWFWVQGHNSSFAETSFLAASLMLEWRLEGLHPQSNKNPRTLLDRLQRMRVPGLECRSVNVKTSIQDVRLDAEETNSIDS